MKRIKTYLLGSAVLVVFALLFTFAHPGVSRAVAEGFKDVRIINPVTMPANVRDVDSPTHQPLHFNGSYTVPAGKRLVIEYVSMGIETQFQCEHLIAGMSSEGVLLHMYHPTLVGTFNPNPDTTVYRYVLSQETRAYVGQNRTVTLELRSWSGCLPDLAHASATGYLVDLQ